MSCRFVDLEVDETGHVDTVGSTVTGPALIVVRDDGVPVGSRFVPRGTAAADEIDHVERRHGAALAAAVRAPVSITVAVCTRNRPELLGRCLHALQRAVVVAGPEARASILVVDNASDDDRTHRVATDMGVTATREPVPGLNVARNRAVAESAGDVLAFIDDDVVVEPTWLRTLVRTFDHQPDAVAVTGGVLAYRLDLESQAQFEASGGFFKGWQAGPLDVAWRRYLPFDPSIGVGCNMAFRRVALSTTGPFDEALDTGPPLAGGGDLDMLVRMAIAGTVVYEPAAMVRHEHRATMDALGAQYRSWGVSWGAVLHKWYRSSPQHRRVIRGAGLRMFRWCCHDIVVRRFPGALRRRDALVMLGGFFDGLLVAYPRSQRRMVRRRLAA